MQKSFLKAGLSGLVAMVLTSHVMGQTVDSPHYSIRKLRAKASKDEYQAKLNREKAELAKEEAEKDRIGADREKEKADREKELAEMDMLKVQKEMTEVREQAEQEMQRVQQDIQRAQQDVQQSKRDLEQAMLEREKAERDRKLAAEDMEVVQRMTGEIVKDGLVPDEQSIVSITLNQDEFLLNGKKQPEAVHKKYASRFLVRSGYKISYHHDR